MCNLRTGLCPKNEAFSWKTLSVVLFVVSSLVIIVFIAWFDSSVENELLKWVTCNFSHCEQTRIPCQCGANTPVTRMRQLHKDIRELKDELRTAHWELKSKEKDIELLKRENEILKHQLKECRKELRACADHKIHLRHRLNPCSSDNIQKIKQQLLEAFTTITKQKQEISELRKHKESSKPSAVKMVELNISHVHAFGSKKNESQSIVQETQCNYPPHYPSAAASHATTEAVFKHPATPSKTSACNLHYVVPETSYIKPHREVKCPVIPKRITETSTYDHYYVPPKTNYITPQVKSPVIEKGVTKTSTYHLPYSHTRSRSIANRAETKCPSTEKKMAEASTCHPQYSHSSIGDKIHQADVICQTIPKERIDTDLYHPHCRHTNTNNIMLQGKIKCPVIRKDIH